MKIYSSLFLNNYIKSYRGIKLNFTNNFFIFVIELQKKMKMKKILIQICLLISPLLINAQDIKLKKEKVLLDGKEILRYDKESWGVYQIHFYPLNSDDEILFIRINDNETPRFFDDDYTEIKFIELKKRIEIKQNKSWSGYLEWLIKNKVMNTDGTINAEKVADLIKNYDEDFTNRTIRD